MSGEAELREGPSGLAPAGAGWFVVNVRDTAWFVNARFGAGCVFEDREHARFPQLGINISVLEPGQPACLYHAEGGQEDFLVLAGACTLIVEGEERPLRAWDFFHSPPGTAHLLVGAGDGPSVVLAVGTRPSKEELRYPVSEIAARYDGSAVAETDDGGVAYAGSPPTEPGQPTSWDALPWAAPDGPPGTTA